MMRIHTEALAEIRAVAEDAAQGRPPIDGGTFEDMLRMMARNQPQTLLELLRHIERGEPLTTGPYE